MSAGFTVARLKTAVAADSVPSDALRPFVTSPSPKGWISSQWWIARLKGKPPVRARVVQQERWDRLLAAISVADMVPLRRGSFGDWRGIMALRLRGGDPRVTTRIDAGLARLLDGLRVVRLVNKDLVAPGASNLPEHMPVAGVCDGSVQVVIMPLRVE